MCAKRVPWATIRRENELQLRPGSPRPDCLLINRSDIAPATEVFPTGIISDIARSRRRRALPRDRPVPLSSCQGRRLSPTSTHFIPPSGSADLGLCPKRKWRPLSTVSAHTPTSDSAWLAVSILGVARHISPVSSTRSGACAEAHRSGFYTLPGQTHAARRPVCGCTFASDIISDSPRS